MRIWSGSTTTASNRVETNGGTGVNPGDRGGSTIAGIRTPGNRYGVSTGGDVPSHLRNIE